MRAVIMGLFAGTILVLAFVFFPISKRESSDAVSRYVDQEYGVVCWEYQSGISCLPLKDTTHAQ
jgi:hypothetical protein